MFWCLSVRFISALSVYPDNAQVIFNDDESDKALTVGHINFLDDDFVPDLCPDKPCPKIIIHLAEKKSSKFW